MVVTEMPLRSTLYMKSLGKLTYYSGLLKTMHYLAELTCVLVLTYTTYASLQKGPLRVQPQPPPVPFFPSNSTVPDFFRGEILEPYSNTLKSDIAVVMYYAPWDFDSQLARKEFLEVAQEFHSQVYFAAINCWAPHGECREQFPNIRSFPMVFAYTRGYTGIQYRGPLTASHMKKFLQSVVHPLQRIDSSEELLRLQSYHNAVVVGHFNFSNNIPAGFHTFYFAALKHMDSDPFRSTVFACVTNKAAAGRLNLNTHVGNGWDIRLYLWNETLIYPNVSGKLDVDKLVNWVSHRYHAPVNWLSPTGRKSFLLQSQLYDTRRPSLVLFADRMNPNQGNFLRLKEVALNYLNCKASARIMTLIAEVHRQVQELKVGRTVLEKSRSSVQCSSRSPGNLSMGDSIFGPRLPRDTCFSASAEDHLYSRLVGLSCKTNRSLNFYAMDSKLHGNYVRSLGVFDPQINLEDTVAVIIDPQEEASYVMKGQSTQQSLEKFILGYAKKSLNRHMRSFPIKQKKSCASDEVCVEEISTRDFEEVVLRNISDVLLLYRKPNCVFCDSAARVFLKTAHMLTETNLNSHRSGPEIIFAVIDGEGNDLPWHFSVDRYPTFVFFPAFRKSQSRVFPHEEELTAASLMRFVVSQLTPKQQLALFLNSCTSVACLKEASKRNYRKAGQLGQQIRSFKFRLSCLKSSAGLDSKLRDSYIDSLQRDLQRLKQERQLVSTIQSHVALQLANMEREEREKQLASGIKGL